MKKLFAVLLVVALVLSLGVTALAAGEKITVVNAPSGVTYRAYQIFTVDDSTTPLVYKTNPAWNSTLMYIAPVDEPADTATPAEKAAFAAYKEQWELANGETYNKDKDKTSAANPLSKNQADKIVYVKDGDDYVVKTLTGFSASEFARFLTPEDVDEAPYATEANYTPSADVLNNPEAKQMAVGKTGYFLVLASKGTPTEYTLIKDRVTVEEYNALSPEGKAIYDTAVHEDPGDNTSPIVAYTASVDTIDATDYDALNGTEKPLYQVSDSDFAPIEEKSMLTTVLTGQEVQIQNKNDMPLDKEVNTDNDGKYDDNNTGVQVGDVLKYKITSKIPELGDNVSSYIYLFTDEMTAGLTPGKKLTINIMKEGQKDSSVAANIDKTITLEYNDDYTLKGTTTPFNFANKTYDPAYELMGNTVRFGKNGYAWELSLDVISTDASSFKPYAGRFITIEYTATVNADAVAEVLENHAVLAYGTDSNNLTVKDAETKNYVSKIQIDKYESGSPTQKLAGAEFALYKAEVIKDAGSDVNDAYGKPTYTIKYYVLKAEQYKKTVTEGEGEDQVTTTFIIGKTEYDALNDTAKGTWTAVDEEGLDVIPWAIWKEVDGEVVLMATDAAGNICGQFAKDDVKVEWVKIDDPTKAADQAKITRVRTGIDGAAQFGYLADSAKYILTNADMDDDSRNSYYLVETKAPVDYTRILDPIPVEVDGSAATAPNMTPQQQETILTNVVNIPNTPGSTLPSTGGVGATMMTIGGIALILAAGAFLVLRRRKEQE